MAMMYRPKNIDYDKELKKCYKKLVKLTIFTGGNYSSGDEKSEYLDIDGELDALVKYTDALEYWKSHPNHV